MIATTQLLPLQRVSGASLKLYDKMACFTEEIILHAMNEAQLMREKVVKEGTLDGTSETKVVLPSVSLAIEIPVNLKLSYVYSLLEEQHPNVGENNLNLPYINDPSIVLPYSGKFWKLILI